MPQKFRKSNRREARGGGAVLGAVKQAEFVTAQVFLLCLSSMRWLVSATTQSAALPDVTDNVDGPHISSITV